MADRYANRNHPNAEEDSDHEGLVEDVEGAVALANQNAAVEEDADPERLVENQEDVEGAVGFANRNVAVDEVNPAGAESIDVAVPPVAFVCFCNNFAQHLVAHENVPSTSGIQSLQELAVVQVAAQAAAVPIQGVPDEERSLFSNDFSHVTNYTEFSRQLSIYSDRVFHHELPLDLMIEINQEMLKNRREVLENTFTAAATTSDMNTKCVICMCNYEEGQPLRYLRCNHYFHAWCIDRWLIEKHECPLCRGNIVNHPPKSNHSQ